MTGLIEGITSYREALKLVKELKLWGYVLVPGLISVLLGVAMAAGAIAFSDDLGRAVISWIPFLEGKGIAETTAAILSAILIIAFGLVFFKQIVMAVAAPIMSPLSEKVERHLAGEAFPEIKISVSGILSDLARGLRISLRNILRELFFTVILLLLGLVPVINLFIPFLIFLVQSYYAGFGNMDYTLERNFRVRGSVAFVRRHRWVAIGNGAVFMLLLFTGIGFLFALPLGTIAGTVAVSRRVG